MDFRYSGSTEQTTIAAVSTPPGTSGLAVIRLSGNLAPEICDRLFLPNKRFAKPSEMPAYSVAVGDWYADEAREQWLDQVVLTRFKAPHSYTGEELYEISCHGSTFAKRAILESLLQSGAAPAGPGEFTKRAFISGKIDLSQAEAVRSLIEAEAARQSLTAGRQLQGELRQIFEQMRAEIYRLMSRIELIIEFPEHEDSPVVRGELQEALTSLLERVKTSVAGYRQGKVVREGLAVVIAGRPNVGKSSLLNRLAGKDRAIVTAIAGTTRDILEADVIIDGLPVLLTDTAGIRLTDDPVEQEGVLRARQAFREADLILWLISPLEKKFWPESIAEIKKLTAQGAVVIPTVAKADLPEAAELASYLRNEFAESEILSFRHDDDVVLQGIREYLIQYFESLGTTDSDQVLVTEARHHTILLKVSENLQLAQDAFVHQLPLEMCSASLRAAAENLAEITGEIVSDTLIDTIFQAFCIGK